MASILAAFLLPAAISFVSILARASGDSLSHLTSSPLVPLIPDKERGGLTPELCSEPHAVAVGLGKCGKQLSGAKARASGGLIPCDDVQATATGASLRFVLTAAMLISRLGPPSCVVSIPVPSSLVAAGRSEGGLLDASTERFSW